MSARLALLVGAALWCGGCQVSSEIGKPCVLVKRATSGTAKSQPVVATDIQADQDFISFGSLECEDLVCVHNAYSDVLFAEDGKSVLGYCSKSCVADALVAPCTVNSPLADATVKANMSCRPLLLDQPALDALRAKNPAEYQATFGNNASPYFCASSVAAPSP